MIIGGAGSGKSTVARKLGALTGLPVVHIDPMYWKAGWVERHMTETHAQILAACAERVARADTFVFLDLPTGLQAYRVLMRTVRYWRRSRPDSADGCPERFNWRFATWVIRYNMLGRPKALQAMAALPPGIAVHHLRSRSEVAGFLEDSR